MPFLYPLDDGLPIFSVDVLLEWSKEWVSLGNKPYNSADEYYEFKLWCYKNKPVASTNTASFLMLYRHTMTDKEFMDALISAMEKIRIKEFC